MSGLVVETAPRRCNHLTRAPIARQATRRSPESLNAARVTASNASARPVVIRSGERKDPGILSMCEIVRRYTKDSPRRKGAKVIVHGTRVNGSLRSNERRFIEIVADSSWIPRTLRDNFNSGDVTLLLAVRYSRFSSRRIRDDW